jgi:hypothetical protein
LFAPFLKTDSIKAKLEKWKAFAAAQRAWKSCFFHNNVNSAVPISSESTFAVNRVGFESRYLFDWIAWSDGWEGRDSERSSQILRWRYALKSFREICQTWLSDGQLKPITIAYKN